MIKYYTAFCKELPKDVEKLCLKMNNFHKFAHINAKDFFFLQLFLMPVKTRGKKLKIVEYIKEIYKEDQRVAFLPKIKAKTKPISKKMILKKILKKTKPVLAQRKSLLNSLVLSNSMKQVDNCPLCFYIMVDARVTKCGHSFCHKCIIESLLYRVSCPLCKQSLKNTVFLRNPIIDQIVALQFWADLRKTERDSHLKQEFEEVRAKHTEWFDDKKPRSVEIGESLAIDFRDKEYFWFPAKATRNSQNEITVEFYRNGRGFSEVLPIGSERIARRNSILCIRGIRSREYYFPLRRIARPPIYQIRNSQQPGIAIIRSPGTFDFLMNLD